MPPDENRIARPAQTRNNKHMSEYQHQNCPHCGQSLTYELDIDKGSVESLKTIAMFIERKGINAVHLTKELGGNGLTSYQIGNISHLRFHGLVAKIKEAPGNYCVTRKGLGFLSGDRIQKTAIIKKGTKGTPPHNIGYGDDECEIKDFDKDWSEYWKGAGYGVREGQIIKPIKEKYPEEQISI